MAVVAGPPKKANWYAAGGGGVVGGLLGLLGGPLVAAGSALVGGGLGYFFGQKLVVKAEHLIPPSALQALGVGGTGGTQAAQVASSGSAKPAATSLYAYLKVHGADGSIPLAQLVAAFQTANNADPTAMALTGPLARTSVYDVPTAAALTIYTQDPIPPATPPAPQPPPSPAAVANIYLPGAAATSGFNLYTYLKGHGNNPTDGSLNKLVHQFQIDVNTDPKFPGPAGVVGQGILKILVPNRLPENGIYDAATSAALTVMSSDPIKP